MSPSVTRSRFLVFVTTAIRPIILARRRARKEKRLFDLFSLLTSDVERKQHWLFLKRLPSMLYDSLAASSQKNPWVARDKTSNMKFFFSIVELGLIYPPDPSEYADRSPKEEIERTLDLSSPKS